MVAAAMAFAPPALAAASKEIQELQRDVALLQEQVKQLQQAQDKNFTALTVLTQQAVDAANRANTAVAVIQSSFQQNIQQQQEKVVAPVVGLSSRMSGLSDDLHSVTQAVSDLASQISKIQSQLTDLSNAVKVMAAPPAPPPAPTGGTTDTSGGAPAIMGATVPPISSDALYTNSGRDREAGNYDLALQEYNDYLKYYGNTDLAPNAQFYIATIHYGQGLYQKAAGEFDLVLEKYPENPKTEEALYYKGLSLVKVGQKTQAGEEFKELINRYPRTDRATQACSQLQALGYRCPTPAAKSTKKKRE